MSGQEFWALFWKELPSADGLIQLLIELGKFATATIVVVCVVWIIWLALEQLRKK